MDFAAFFAKWFIAWYIALGFLFIGGGLYLIIKNQAAEAFLINQSHRQKPPRLFITILKYFLLFSLPGLLLSLIYFSWVELLFSLWILLLVYFAGIRLVKWEQTKTLIEAKKEKLTEVISRCGAITVSVGFVMFLLAYLVIQKAYF